MALERSAYFVILFFSYLNLCIFQTNPSAKWFVLVLIFLSLRSFLRKLKLEYVNMLELTSWLFFSNSSKGSNQNTDPTVDQSKPRGRGRPLYQSELRGQTFYNSEYGELSEQSEEGSCTPPTEGTSPSLLHASFFSDQC